MSISFSEQEQIRRDSLAELFRLGVNPYPPETFPVNVSSAEIKKNYPADTTLYQEVSIAGRIMTRRSWEPLLLPNSKIQAAGFSFM